MASRASLDRYVIERLEAHMDYPIAVMVLRGALNPSRSFANLLRLREPWARDNRPDVWMPQRRPFLRSRQEGEIVFPHPAGPEIQGPYAVAPVEVSFSFKPQWYFGGTGACTGGGAETALRLNPALQMVLDMHGCKINNLVPNFSGDTLSYLAGPRWTPRPASRWSPYVQLLIGGMKVSEERMDPLPKAALDATATEQDPSLQLQDQYTSTSNTTNFSLSVGGGLDYRFTPAVALRVASLTTATPGRPRSTEHPSTTNWSSPHPWSSAWAPRTARAPRGWARDTMHTT